MLVHQGWPASSYQGEAGRVYNRATVSVAMPGVTPSVMVLFALHFRVGH